MVRSFAAEPVDAGRARPDPLGALRAPTAGNTAGHGLGRPAGAGRRRRPTGTPPTDEAWRPGTGGPAAARAPVVLFAYARPAPTSPATPSPTRRPRGLGDRERPGRCPTGSATPRSASWRCCWGRSTPASGACVLGNFRGEAELATARRTRRAGGCSAPCCSATLTARTTGLRRWTGRARG